ncbi:hypothetical protein TYRP_022897 [Tyrophagus putrescentiae]|nr:hypothetical protein TYRP_022897 [Tyrophagus putrescentiae]
MPDAIGDQQIPRSAAHAVTNGNNMSMLFDSSPAAGRYEGDEEKMKRGDAAMQDDKTMKMKGDYDEDIIFLSEVKHSTNSNSNSTINDAQPCPSDLFFTSGSSLGRRLKSSFAAYPSTTRLSHVHRRSGAVPPQLKRLETSAVAANDHTHNNTAAQQPHHTQAPSPYHGGAPGHHQSRLRRTSPERVNRPRYGITKQACRHQATAQLMGDNFVHTAELCAATAITAAAATRHQAHHSLSNHFTSSHLNNNKSHPLLRPKEPNQNPASKAYFYSRSPADTQHTTAALLVPRSSRQPGGQLLRRRQRAKSGASSSSMSNSKSGGGNVQLTSAPHHQQAAPEDRLKRLLLLPRLLQGTETYQSYASTSKTPSETDADEEEMMSLKSLEENHHGR